MNDSDVYEGGCFCGTIRYRFRGVVDAGYCHCSICRRITGAPLIAWVNTLAKSFEVTQGEPQFLSTSEHFERAFCSKCATQIFTRGKRENWRYVSLHHGSIDRAAEIRPRVHLCYADRLPWFDIDDGLLRVEGNALQHPEERG